MMIFKLVKSRDGRRILPAVAKRWLLTRDFLGTAHNLYYARSKNSARRILRAEEMQRGGGGIFFSMGIVRQERVLPGLHSRK